MGNAKFRGLPAPNPLGRFSKKNCRVDYVGDPTPHANIGVNRFKGACLRMREIVTPRRVFFFFFLGFMRLASGRPAGPIIAVNGSNDASLWRSLRFYFFVNKKYFSVFYPKM